MGEMDTREYWEKELAKTKNHLDDINMDIDSLLEDVGELKDERDELFKEYEEIKAELEAIDKKEEGDLHDFRMKNDMVYHALHTPSQKRLVI